MVDLFVVEVTVVLTNDEGPFIDNGGKVVEAAVTAEEYV
jgi:hypothetical protein